MNVAFLQEAGKGKEKGGGVFFFPVTRQLYGCLSRIFSRSYNLRLLVNHLSFHNRSI